MYFVFRVYSQVLAVVVVFVGVTVRGWLHWQRAQKSRMVATPFFSEFLLYDFPVRFAICLTPTHMYKETGEHTHRYTRHRVPELK